MPRVDNKGVSIHYRVEGNGPPVVLGHGVTDSSDVFYERGYVAALKPKYRLVLIDARGHGQSDKPHDPQSYTSEKVASDIVAVLDDLGMKTAVYWGYSLGGRYGFALARHALDRVASFVIGGAPASAESGYAAEPGKEGLITRALRAGPDEVIRVWGEGVTPALRERLWANDAAALIACLQRPLDEFLDVLGTIGVPTLLYAGSADPIHNAARQAASEISGAQFVSFPGLSHPQALWRSDLVLPHVEPFLAKATGSSYGAR
jgi:pimeloyl-ACP methyl ester carboxylesterase